MRASQGCILYPRARVMLLPSHVRAVEGCNDRLGLRRFAGARWSRKFAIPVPAGNIRPVSCGDDEGSVGGKEAEIWRTVRQGPSLA